MVPSTVTSMSFYHVSVGIQCAYVSFLISIAKGMVLTAFMERTAFFDVYIFKVEVEVIECSSYTIFRLLPKLRGMSMSYALFSV